MKSSILIASYLSKDTWSRWREQPGSLVARLFVGAMLAAVATVILVAFTLLERSVRLRLEKFGLNTLVVREPIASTDPELINGGDRPDRLDPLRSDGQKLRLRQLYIRAQTDMQREVPVFSYPNDALAALAPWLDGETPLVLINDSLPENIRVRVTLHRHSGVAVVRHGGEFFRRFGADQALLVPQGWMPDVERIGFIETTLFERDTAALPMKQYVDSVNLVFALDRRNPPQIQSALPLIDELGKLEGRHKQWRAVMAGVLGLALALVYGSIAMLEFRQNLFVSALLRSLGAPRRLLYLRQWIENFLLANVAAIGAIAVIAKFHSEIFGTLGFPESVLRSGVNPYLSHEVLLILIWVNVGAFLSSLPVAIGLRKPVGSVLS